MYYPVCTASGLRSIRGAVFPDKSQRAKEVLEKRINKGPSFFEMTNMGCRFLNWGDNEPIEWGRSRKNRIQLILFGCMDECQMCIGANACITPEHKRAVREEKERKVFFVKHFILLRGHARNRWKNWEQSTRDMRCPCYYLFNGMTY